MSDNKNLIGMSEETTLDDKTVHVICPICNKDGDIYIPISAINKPKGLTCVTIAPKIVCEHVFQIYLDKDLKIRGYSKSDYDVGFLKIEDDTFQEIRENTIVNFVEETPKDKIPSEYWPVISKINGLRSVAEIIESSNYDKKFIFKVLIELRSMNLISFDFVFNDFDIPKLNENGQNFLLNPVKFIDGNLYKNQYSSSLIKPILDEKRFELIKNIDSKNNIVSIANKCSIGISQMKKVLGFLQRNGYIEISSERLNICLIFENVYQDFVKTLDKFLGKNGIEIFKNIINNKKDPLIKLIKISNGNQFSFEAVISHIENQKELNSKELELNFIAPILNTFQKIKPALSMLSSNYIDEFRNRVLQIFKNLKDVFGSDKINDLKKYFL